MQDRILFIDLGSLVSYLISRHIREAGVYSKIVLFLSAEKALDWPGLKGAIGDIQQPLGLPAAGVHAMRPKW
ncbi:MAG: hypothetical protein ACKVQR_08410 [Aquabacterium sp.]